MAVRDQPGNGRTVVLRRQSARVVEGRPRGGYTDMFEVICCDCGDGPSLDYSEASRELHLIPAPYPLVDGISASIEQCGQHRQPARATSRGRGRMLADRR
jgi:hypothetical protein